MDTSSSSSSCTTTATMEIHQQSFNAAHLNNQAASLIECGDYRNAILQLKLALKPVKQIMNKSGCSSCEGGQQQRGKMVLDHVMATYPHRNEAATTTREEQYQTAAGFIYGQAIFVPIDVVQLSDTDYFSRLTIAIAVTFNLALSHQLLAKQGGAATHDLLGKAARIYERAFTLFRNHGSDGGTLFALASLNNMAMIYQAAGNEMVAGKCFDRLLSMLMILVDRGHQQSSPCFDGFLRNTAHLVSQQKVAAAA